MKKYMNNITGETFTIEELEKAFEDVREDIPETTFEEWFDEEIRKGLNGQDGLVEADFCFYLIDQKGDDIWVDTIPRETAEEAVEYAKAEWSALSEHDKKQREAFYVALGTENEDGYDFDSEEFIVDVMIDGIKITINFPTGNVFEDGTPEIGKTQEEVIFSREDLDNILDEIEEGTDYFLTDADGNEISAYDLACMLD